MTIPLIREPAEMEEQWSGVNMLFLLEVCYFCHTKTKYWHENTNNPVCPDCANKHKVGELPDHGQRIRANKRKAP